MKNRKRDRSNLKALFIPGGHDDVVIRLAELHCEKELKTLAGATQLFGEPGALEAVAHLAADGFASFRAIHRTCRVDGAEEAERAQYLDQLAKRETAVWNAVIACIQQRQPKGYDRAIHFLIDLRDLAIRQGHETEFRAKIEDLRVKHAAKRSFIEQLIKADI